MKQLVLFFTLIIFSPFATAQEESCGEKINSLLIDKIKSYNSNELIPYYSSKNEKWGYFNKNNGKIVTEPILKNPKFFNPKLRLYYELETNGSDNGCDVTINSSAKNYETEGLRPSNYTISEAAGNRSKNKNAGAFIKNDITGFEVNSNNELTYFNERFYDPKENESTIIKILIFKDQYFAIVGEKDHCSIIRQNGELMPGFENLKKYPYAKYNYKSDTDIWFLIENADKKYTFKSLLENRSLQEVFDQYPNGWSDFESSTGYALIKDTKNSGLLDLTTMQWKIKFEPKNKFEYLYYSSLENIVEDQIEYNRTITTSYILNSKNQFMDLAMKIYKPKR